MSEATGQPRYEIRDGKGGPAKGRFFVLIDSQGKEVYESNVYWLPDPEEFCEDGAQRELATWKEKGKIS